MLAATPRLAPSNMEVLDTASGPKLDIPLPDTRLHSHFSSTHTLYPLSSQWWPRCPCVGRGRQLELFHRRTSSVVEGNIEHTSHWRSSLIPRDTRLRFCSCLQVNFYNIIYMSLCIAFGFSPWQEITLVAWQQECCLLKITMLSPATSNIGNQGHFHFNFQNCKTSSASN